MTEDTAVKGTVTDAALEGFRHAFRGQIILPTEDGFDAARKVWNGSIDKFPGAIVRPTGVADVISAVNFARDNELELAVRCGGHSMSGQSSSDGGLVIDLSAMRSVRVNPATSTVNVAGGALLGDVDHETAAFGLAVPCGTVSHTGVGGLTLGGGLGRLHRKHGLTVDNLLSVDIVTADGRLVHASETENAELFWGIRGAGPNFGIVVNFEFQAHPMGPFINAMMLAFDPASARDVLPAYRAFTEQAPDEVLSIAAFSTAGPPMPPELHGRKILMVGANHCGTPEEAERDLAPLKEIPGALFQMAMPVPYLMMQRINDEVFAHGKRYADKGGYLKELSDDAIDVLAKHAEQAPGEHDEVIIFQMGGAAARVPEDAMAFSGRNAPFFVGIMSIWTDPAEDAVYRDWGRTGMAALSPHLLTTNYVNAAEEESDIRAVYGDAKYERLVKLKNEWDPTNLFRLNANIKPTV